MAITFSRALITSSVKALNVRFLKHTHIILSVLCAVYLKNCYTHSPTLGKQVWLINSSSFFSSSIFFLSHPVSHTRLHTQTWDPSHGQTPQSFQSYWLCWLWGDGCGRSRLPQRHTSACGGVCVHARLSVTLKRQWELITVAERESRMRERWRRRTALGK